MSIARAITSFTEREIRSVFFRARTVFKAPEMEIRTAPATGPFGRILIVLPRTVGTAPERNLIKRRIKAIFYQSKLYEQNKDVIVLVRKHAQKFSFADLEQLLTAAVTSR